MPGMRIYTRKGDSGTTGLLFGGDRVSKADLRTDAYGTTDEAVSALGLARAIDRSRHRPHRGSPGRAHPPASARAVRRRRRAGNASRSTRPPDRRVSRVTAEMVTALEGGDRFARGARRAADRVRDPGRVDDRRGARPRSNDGAARGAAGRRALGCRGASGLPGAAVSESACRPVVRRRASGGWWVPPGPQLTLQDRSGWHLTRARTTV